VESLLPGVSRSWLQPFHRHQTVVKGPSGLPPVDRLLQFLVDSSRDGVEVVHCANCDLECSKQAGGQRGWGAVGTSWHSPQYLKHVPSDSPTPPLRIWDPQCGETEVHVT
jgi:hypothetical protein